MAIEKMVRVSSKGQIVLPKRLREKLGISEGDYILVKEQANGSLLLEKQGAGSIEPILEKFREAARAANLTPEDLEKAIEEARDGIDVQMR